MESNPKEYHKTCCIRCNRTMFVEQPFGMVKHKNTELCKIEICRNCIYTMLVNLELVLELGTTDMNPKLFERIGVYLDKNETKKIYKFLWELSQIVHDTLPAPESITPIWERLSDFMADSTKTTSTHSVHGE